MVATLCSAMLPVRGKTRGNVVARRVDTRNVSEDFQKRFCIQDTKFAFVTNVARVAKRTRQYLENMPASEMSPPQCVLISPGPLEMFDKHCNKHAHDGKS